MSVYKDSLELVIKIDNRELDISPKSFSFSIRDSVYKLYSEGSLKILDSSGIMQEIGVFTEGLEVEIDYGLKDETILKSKFVIVDDDLEVSTSQTYIAGTVNLNLFNPYYNYQNILSKSYSNKSISDIVRLVVNRYGKFSKTNIDGTGNILNWYQPLMTDSEFINKILLPNAYSKVYSDYPFFCYINSNNEFNFKNYKSLISQPPIKLKFISDSTKNPEKNTITYYRRFSEGNINLRTFKNRKTYYQDITNGAFTEEKDSFIDYPNNNNKKTQIIKTNNIINYYDLGKKLVSKNRGYEDNIEGRKVFSMREATGIEKFLVVIPLNVEIVAGKLVELEIPMISNKGNEDLSQRYCDKYLVERVDHTWDCGREISYTQLVISRRYTKYQNDNIYKDKVF